MRVDSKRVENEPELIAALRDEVWDLVISDHLLPQLSAARALEIVKNSGKDLPFIIVSGQMGEDLAVESMRNGADDYLVKGRLKQLPVAIERSIEAAKTRTARTLAQQNLQTSERRLRAFALHLTDVRERDRATICTEVHDEIERVVAAGSAARQPVQLETDIREAAELVQKAVDASQKLYISLRGNLLDQGIVAALEWRLTQLQKRTGIAAHLSASPAEFHLHENVALATYFAATELIENVEMHAHSRNIWCAVFYISGNLTIEIRDDGKGCTLTQLMDPAKFGVFLARERIRSLGGTLDFDTTYTGLETGTAALITINNLEQPTATQVAT
jgi:signal transduction histidine kinase